MWFGIKVCTTLLWTWVVSQALVDNTETGRIIGCPLDTVQALSVSGTDSNEIITPYFHTSLRIHPESNNHVQMYILVQGNMLFLSLKKKRSGKASLKTDIIGIDDKVTINKLMKHSYIAVGYIYH